MFRLRIAEWAILFCLIFPIALSFSGEIYRWTDEKGSVHFTDDISNIPAPYRNQVEKREVTDDISNEIQKQIDSERKPDTPADNTNSPARQGEKTERVREYLKVIEEKLEEKRTIEKKISKLEEEMEAAKERIKELEKDEEENYPAMQPFQGRGGRFGFVSVETPHYREKVKWVNRIRATQEEIATLEKRLSEIRRSL